jgi:P-type Cu+ transporter
VPDTLEQVKNAIDPVCGMTVDPATAKHSWEHAGKNYYFCCGGCREKFRTDPARFLNQPAQGHGSDVVTLGMPKAAVSSGIQIAPAKSAVAPITHGPPAQQPGTSGPDERYYVCPMCPEVRQVGPGPCPSCGMALEPETPLPTTKVEYTCPMHPEIVRPGPGI